MNPTEKEIHAKLMEPVGKPVAFKYPGSHVQGYLRDREIVLSGPFDQAIYWDVIDLIEFPQEEHRYWVRISYYRQVGTSLRFAGQTSIAEPIHVMRRVIAQAAESIAKWTVPNFVPTPKP